MPRGSTYLLLAISAALARAGLAGAAESPPPSSFTVRAYEFDRGNVAIYETGRSYADTDPVLVNAEKYPNFAEYDLAFPVAGAYTIAARYAAAEARPVALLLDGVPLGEGLKGTTGSWQASTARWEDQVTVQISAGTHTFRLARESCIPHLVAFRFTCSQAFPAGWQRRSKPLPEQTQPFSGKPEAGKFGYQAYVRPDGFVDAPGDYDPTVPYELLPQPNPRGERILEYLLMGPGRYEVRMALETPEEGGAPAARLSVQLGDRTETELLALDPARIRRMLEHTRKLAALFGRGEDDREALAGLAELARLEKLPPTGESAATGLYALYVQAYRLKNRTALSNPLLGFGRLVFVRRYTYDTSHIYTTYFDGSHRYGGGLALLQGLRPDATVAEIATGLPAPAIYRDPDLSWDARKLLFSYKPDLATPCRIYEIGLDGKGLRRLTGSEYDDIDPCYLPDDRIMFVSTRCRRVVLCHNAFTVSVLHRMDADGGNVQCVSANTVNDFTPSLLHDGRVAYTKWEYVDKQLGNNQSLWAVNPDGGSPSHIAGEHWGPITFWEPRAIPGSSKLVTTLAPHMPLAVGPIALVDPADACSSPARYESLTPEIPPPHHFGWHRPRMGFYCSPYPLSEDFHIVSYSYGPDDRDPRGYAIYLLDRWNNRDLIYRDPDLSCFEALPVQPRPRPPALPDAGQTAGASGSFCVLNVNEGLPGIAAGAVKYLRVVEEIPKPVAAQCSGPWLQYPLISYGGHLALKQLLGEVPVAADGSVSFQAPANRALYFSALDGNHMEVQRMRAMTELRPGEVRSCVGCHEQRTTAPPLRRPQALARPVRALSPPPGGPRAPDFYRDVQPLLTRNCVTCHGAVSPAGGLDLSPALTNRFNVAYETLMTGGLISYVVANRSDTLPLRGPKYYGSHASKLMQVLAGSHRDRVSLTAEEHRELVTWIDLNAPYYSTYRYSRPGTEGGRELLTPPVRGALHAAFKQSCARCHGGDTARVERVNFEVVGKSPALLSCLPLAAGGTGKCGQVFTSREDPAAKPLLQALALLQQELRSNPREDVQAVRPPLADDKPRYVYRP